MPDTPGSIVSALVVPWRTDHGGGRNPANHAGQGRVDPDLRRGNYGALVARSSCCQADMLHPIPVFPAE